MFRALTMIGVGLLPVAVFAQRRGGRGPEGARPEGRGRGRGEGPPPEGRGRRGGGPSPEGRGRRGEGPSPEGRGRGRARGAGGRG